MAFVKNRWAVATLAILCITIAVASAAAYYYNEYMNLRMKIAATKFPASIAIDYGNGTRQWFNGTFGPTLYDAMLQAGWGVSTTSFGVTGLYVNAINSVRENQTVSVYWGWWSWTSFGWTHGGTACDKYILSNQETVIWYYSHADPTTFVMTAPEA